MSVDASVWSMLLGNGALGLAGVLGVVWAFRRSRQGHTVGVGWTLLATLWCSEVLLRAWLAAVAPPTPAPRFSGRETLPLVDGYPAPASLAEPASDAPTLLFLGDSFTVGEGLPYDDTFVAGVARELAPEVPGLRVINHAREGRGTLEEAALYAGLGVPLAPDVVVWVFFLNDLSLEHRAGTDFVTRFDRGPGTGLAVIDVPLRTWDAHQLTTETEAGYHEALTRSDKVEALEALVRGVADEVHARGGRLVFAIFPVLHKLDAYPFVAEHQGIADAAQRGGAEVVDLYPSLAGRKAQDLWLRPDDHHPNEAGHAAVVPALAQAIRAAPFPAAGPADCARTPSINKLTEPLRAACMAGSDGAALLTAAEALHAAEADAVAPMVSSVMADLAAVAASRGADLPRAEALIHAFRDQL